MDSGVSCFKPTISDQVNTDARLGPLVDNGGPTYTHALLIGSPAIDRGLDLSAQGMVTDQRGRLRPDGGGYDIGAYETRKIAPPSCLAPLLMQP